MTRKARTPVRIRCEKCGKVVAEGFDLRGGIKCRHCGHVTKA